MLACTVPHSPGNTFFCSTIFPAISSTAHSCTNPYHHYLLIHPAYPLSTLLLFLLEREITGTSCRSIDAFYSFVSHILLLHTVANTTAPVARPSHITVQMTTPKHTVANPQASKANGCFSLQPRTQLHYTQAPFPFVTQAVNKTPYTERLACSFLTLSFPLHTRSKNRMYHHSYPFFTAICLLLCTSLSHFFFHCHSHTHFMPLLFLILIISRGIRLHTPFASSKIQFPSCDTNFDSLSQRKFSQSTATTTPLNRLLSATRSFSAILFFLIMHAFTHYS